MQTLRIHNWDQWQSYRRDRGQPPWIKVHREIMRKVEWVGMTDAQRGQLVAIWLLAADRDGVIPASPEIVQKLCFMDSPPDLNFFVQQGFIDDVGGVTSERRQVGVEATNQNRDRDRIETEEDGEKPSSRSQNREPDRSDEIRRVFEYWQEFMKHPRAKLDDKRRRKIRDRLKDGYEVGDLITAIQGCAKSPHNMGENKSGTVYDDIELICRDGSHVDRFIKTANDPDMTRMSSAARQTAKAASQWLSEGNS